MKSYQYLFLLVIASVFSACQLLEPENDNHDTFDRVFSDPSYAEGLLLRAYVDKPMNDFTWDEVATDDAVSNVRANSYLLMGTGAWSSNNNAQDLWTNCNRSIMYINKFLSVVDRVPFKPSNAQANKLFIRRLTGEAYGLRGLMKFFLLRNHAGVGTNNELLGIPIYNNYLEKKEDYSIPRATFAESVKSAYDDLDQAMKYLPMDYADIKALSSLPANYNDITATDDYNFVCGDATRQRFSGRIALAVKSRIALLHASPAFNPGNDQGLWQKAADYAAELLDATGGTNGLDPSGHLFYLKTQVDNANLAANDLKDIPEMLWRERIVSERTKETNFFPPSIYGSGQINPSQNLVNAFPMKNGYPIDHASAAYDASKPYDNRDPRLANYIVYNGSKMRNTTINTNVGGGVDGLDASTISTRTGYYLKKFLREDVNVDPKAASSQNHIDPYIRYTEIFLNYAEAANELWGPDGNGGHAYTAKDVIRAIRKRAGITQPDTYLASISSLDDMRNLIRNERRLELCFESFRFWDLRRWKVDMANLTEPVKGIRIENGTYTEFKVEDRKFQNYMYYGPIPKSEIIKFNLIQNIGWD